MEFELEMRIPPVTLAVCPHHAPRLMLFMPCRATLSLQVPLTRMVDPCPALGRAALMLGYTEGSGFVPEQSTTNCACRAIGRSSKVKMESLCKPFIMSSRVMNFVQDHLLLAAPLPIPSVR